MDKNGHWDYGYDLLTGANILQQGRRRMTALVAILLLGSPVLGIASFEAGQFHEEPGQADRAEYTHTGNSMNIEGSQAGTVFASQILAVGNSQTCGILHNGSMLCWGPWGSTSILPAYMDLGGNRTVVSVDSSVTQKWISILWYF